MEKFVKEFHPEVEEEYQRYKRRYRLPKVGTILESLRNGFGGMGGQELKVVELGDKYITLTDGKTQYLSNINVWWKELKILIEE